MAKIKTLLDKKLESIFNDLDLDIKEGHLKRSGKDYLIDVPKASIKVGKGCCVTVMKKRKEIR